jgi:hypothetical protein
VAGSIYPRWIDLATIPFNPGSQRSLRCWAHAVRQLELAEHRGDVRLDGLHRDEELRGDLLVGEASCDEPHHLLLPRREAVELVVAVRPLAGDGAEGVKHEPGKAR